MNRTLIIYESHYGTTKKIGYYLSLILGFSKHVDIENAPYNLDGYPNIIFLFCFYGHKTAEKLKVYLDKINMYLPNKNIALIGVGLEQSNLASYTSPICSLMSKKPDIIEFLHGNLIVNKLNEHDKILLQSFLKKNNINFEDVEKFNMDEVVNCAYNLKDYFYQASANKINNDKLLNEIEKFITSHNTCSLATCNNSSIRNTPIEYIYYKNNFYFITEGGLKFLGLLQNENVSICIYDSYKSMDKVFGIQISGIGEIIPETNSEYYSIMKKKNLTKELLNKFSVNLFLIKVCPSRFEFLNTNFSKNGYEPKQILDFKLPQ